MRKHGTGSDLAGKDEAAAAAFAPDAAAAATGGRNVDIEAKNAGDDCGEATLVASFASRAEEHTLTGSSSRSTLAKARPRRSTEAGHFGMLR
jgi:hypothetical protein